jgi:hypothetical protein
MASSRTRLGVAVLAALAVVLSAPFSQQLFTEVGARWPAQSRPLGMAASLVPAALALVAAVRRIRDRHAIRYVALVGSGAIAAGYIVAAGLSFAEAFHFIEYGLIGFLFYRAWRPLEDIAVLVLPLLAGTVAGTLDEWFQWFIPLRAGEARDVGLNIVALGCGLLFALAADPPPRLTARLTPASRRLVVVVAAMGVLALALFVNSVHVGYAIADSQLGTFESRYTYDELLSVRDARAAAWREQPPVVLRRVSREDQYLGEAMFHVTWRNRMWTEGNIFAAWRENRILETYYAPVLDTPSYRGAGHRWPAEQRADAEVRAADTGQAYVSGAYPIPMLLW